MYIVLMLYWMAEDRERQAQEGKLQLAEGERLYKPILIALPAGTLDQCFNEINREWSGVFDVHSFYGHPGFVSNDARRAKTLHKFDGLQSLVNALANKSNDPRVSLTKDRFNLLPQLSLYHGEFAERLTDFQTGRTIILAAYTTITWRMTVRKDTEWCKRGEKPQTDPSNQKDPAQNLPSNPTETEDNEQKAENGAPGQEVQKRERPSRLKNSDWSVVVTDDCHSLKNPCSTIHKIIASLPRESILFVSATPLSNHIRDIIGYLNLIWNTNWPFSYDETGKESVDSYYHPDSWEKIKESGSFEHITTERLLTGPRSDNSPEATTSLSRRFRLEYESFIREGKGPLHLLNPQLFQHYAIAHDWSTEVSTNAVKPIMDMMSLKREILSQMTMPDGSMTCLGKNLKNMTVRTIELQPHEADKGELAQFCESLSNDLIRQQEFTAPELVSSGAIIASPKHLLNTSALRRLMCVSTDLGNRKLTDSSGRLARVVQKSWLTKFFRSNPRGDKDVAESIAAQREKEKPRAAGGCREVDEITYTDNTGGLRFHFYRNRPSAAYSFPINRIAQVKVVAYRSPKYRYVIREALDAQKEGEKLLCYVNCPLTSQ